MTSVCNGSVLKSFQYIQLSFFYVYCVAILKFTF